MAVVLEKNDANKQLPDGLTNSIEIKCSYKTSSYDCPVSYTLAFGAAEASDKDSLASSAAEEILKHHSAGHNVKHAWNSETSDWTSEEAGASTGAILEGAVLGAAIASATSAPSAPVQGADPKSVGHWDPSGEGSL